MEGNSGSKGIKTLTSIIAGCLLIFFCVGVIGVGLDKLGCFFDVPSIAITVGITGGYLLLAFGLNDLFIGMYIAVTGRSNTERGALKAIEVCRAAAYTFIISGIIGTLIGLINMLSQGMDDPSVLTSGVAVALITVLYGVLAAGLCYVLEGRSRIALLEIRKFPVNTEGDNSAVEEVINSQNVDRVRRPVLLFLTGLGTAFILLVGAVLIGTMVSGYDCVRVNLDIKNSSSGKIVLIPEPLYADKPDTGHFWDKPVLISGSRTWTEVRIKKGIGFTGFRYQAVDLDNGKIYKLYMPSNDQLIDENPDIAIVVEDNGLRFAGARVNNVEAQKIDGADNQKTAEKSDAVK